MVLVVTELQEFLSICTIDWRHETGGLLLLCKLAHNTEEVIDRLLRDLNVNDKSRTAELERVREVLGPLGDLIVGRANRSGIVEDLPGFVNGSLTAQTGYTHHTSLCATQDVHTDIAETLFKLLRTCMNLD